MPKLFKNEMSLLFHTVSLAETGPQTMEIQLEGF